MKRSIFTSITFILITVLSYAQPIFQSQDHGRYFVGSSLYVPYAQFVDPSPNYYQLNLGMRLNSRNTLTIEAITWRNTSPLGIPYGSDSDVIESEFPGQIESIGVGLSYQHFIWKGTYLQVHSTGFKQNYLDKNDVHIQSGFQLFNSFRIGYHISLFDNRFFIEPSVATTWWPINTNMPVSFKVREERWNQYFMGEPGIHFGINL